MRPWVLWASGSSTVTGGIGPYGWVTILLTLLNVVVPPLNLWLPTAKLGGQPRQLVVTQTVHGAFCTGQNELLLPSGTGDFAAEMSRCMRCGLGCMTVQDSCAGLAGDGRSFPVLSRCRTLGEVQTLG